MNDEDLRNYRWTIDYPEDFSELTPNMSGADIASIVNESALIAVRNKKKAVEEAIKIIVKAIEK